jgi:hypothetical protein
MATGSDDKYPADFGTWAGATLRYFKARPKLLQDLQQRTIELMGVPQLRCRIRKCRRRRRCCFLRQDDRSPWCLCKLKPEERAGFQLLLDKAMRHYVQQAMPARPPQTELDHAVLELERAIRPAGDPRLVVLRAFWRRQSATDRRQSSGTESPLPRNVSE